MVKIFHIIADLNVGGAETMLKRLIEVDPPNMPGTVVVSLTSIGDIGETLRARGVIVCALGMSSVLDFPVILWRLFRLIRQYRPRIIQTWMYHADLLGGLAARLAGSRAIVWGIRGTNIPQGSFSVTFWLVRLCAVFSYFIPDKIICCAKSAKAWHVKLGYAGKKMVVVPNGYDFSASDLHLKSRVKARAELGYGENEIVIGAVGRFDPLKDFQNLVVAASYLCVIHGNVKILMVGRNIEWSNNILTGWIESAGLAKEFQLIGEKTDLPYFLSAMDVFCLSSSSEGFPNVVVEAMAMGLPCVVTRAGDAAEIVGDGKFVVPIKDSIALSNALSRMCDLKPEERKNIGEAGAKRVKAEYAIDKIWHKYEEAYVEAMRS
jgi:glycosyltransferase involved in cell wall biosynthesis